MRFQPFYINFLKRKLFSFKKHYYINILKCLYFIFKNGEAYLFGATIQPLSLASTHVVCDPTRTRKLLLNKRELDNLFGKSSRDGFTIVALSLYWKGAWAKIKIGLAKGKKQHDKRDDIKEREWKVAKERIMKNAHRG